MVRWRCCSREGVQWALPEGASGPLHALAVTKGAISGVSAEGWLQVWWRCGRSQGAANCLPRSYGAPHLSLLPGAGAGLTLEFPAELLQGRLGWLGRCLRVSLLEGTEEALEVQQRLMEVARERLGGLTCDRCVLPGGGEGCNCYGTDGKGWVPCGRWSHPPAPTLDVDKGHLPQSVSEALQSDPRGDPHLPL